MTMGLAALRLLVVDDNAQMRTIVGTVLTAAGVRQLHYAPDGRRGLEAVREFKPDVCYVDHEMPVMNGLDFISAVRSCDRSERYLPIIMLTGYSDMIRLNAARDLGVTEFLCKPVTARTILNRLNAVIMHPRPFVTASEYVGPDRRRKRMPNYRGPLRRTGDTAPARGP
ncbi:MAG TPA: response regulator [Caulobacteraceae bacterium]|jgi:CheY-like chemotaxis protein|nr:response regulator [Caulobacteraceae bacterium]